MTALLWALDVVALWLVCSGIALAIYRICYRARYGEWP